MIRHIVPASVVQMPLERYIRRAWPMLPGGALRNLLKKRDVKINGVRMGQSAVVCGGDELLLYLPDTIMDSNVASAYNDGCLLVAVKPQGLPVDVDQDGIGADTLIARLQSRYPSAQLCHRLDAPTGGLVMVALDDAIHAQALETFRTHGLRKTYYALAKGGFDRKEGVLRAWLLKDAKQSRVRVVHSQQRDAKPIETRYRVISEKSGIARVELEPITGRTHQLRAHMADFGHPLLGDDKYGDREWNKKHPSGLCLWCASLALNEDSPLIDYRGIKIVSDLPEWWTEQK